MYTLWALLWDERQGPPQGFFALINQQKKKSFSSADTSSFGFLLDLDQMGLK